MKINKYFDEVRKLAAPKSIVRGQFFIATGDV